MAEMPQWTERFVLLYFSGPEARTRIPEMFPAHHAYTLDFQASRPGELLLTGPFADTIEGQAGAMNVFTTREAAETFAASDPFVTEGVAESWLVRTWLLGGE
ncbi:YciI family protein [Microbacterium sp. 4R-513]|uniref:YciI family protein n=1 Tax=Microbacterium sp. 4R-513 TaxID=2567934 RepID=UPI0019D25F8E|nr:YciI family protein [Microbacterium sp. 4R-513]